ncbi:MAG: nucleoside triphosphate pyrophosphohydrolase [Muribaculaceae bacterium]|nr:nucleoside triphosphate pyrophosphohydrolase [Muribaculaceae bacterium]
MNHTRAEQLESIRRLLDTLDILRVKCPWDAKQTNESLRPNTIEEVYELTQALLDDKPDEIKKELGDVLLHVIFYAKIGSESGRFDIGDVAEALNDKLIFRHPHIFGNVKADDADAVAQNWEQIKLKEKGGNKTVLAGVPAALPALVKAFRIQEKAANVGFDWESREQVWDKVAEETTEVAAAIKVDKKEDIEAEFGDLLFSIINAARLYGVNPENALERTNRKFISRFNYIEEKAKEAGRKLGEMTLDEMDALWNEAKKETGI